MLTTLPLSKHRIFRRIRIIVMFYKRIREIIPLPFFHRPSKTTAVFQFLRAHKQLYPPVLVDQRQQLGF